MRVPSILGVFSIALALSPSLASAQDAPSLDALLARFAASPGMEARFREEKRIALLAVPTRSEGHIWFAAPNRMLRRTERPEESAALIAEGQLRMRSGEQTEVLEIDSNPVLRGFVDSFRAVLAGDRASLARFYDAELTRNAEAGEDGWELRLRPRQDALRRFLREIRMVGTGTTIRSMRMLEVNGDETRTEFFDVNTSRRYSAAEARRIFRL
ncbi:MAG: outer membrane lipoprotein carrier protein LolA [Sandaracinaceae bacterium]